ncbi:MAG: hypothetical protein HYY66_07530, partial [Candidatus Tectomicrobia bacterium]|nr:hypothetical protein [Candidatus Tectomicrobia bacterium]
RLARAPGAIRVRELVEAIEGPGVFERCIFWSARCDAASPCPLHDGWMRASAGLVRFLEDFCAYDSTRMMHAGNPMTLRSSPGAYEKYFRGWLRAHELKKKDPEKYARVYTGALAETGDKGEYPVVLAVVKRLRSEPAITPEVKAYMVDMAEKQKKLGWIKTVPRFDRGVAVDGSIFDKVAASQRN